jgi:hypothetical protein
LVGPPWSIKREAIMHTDRVWIVLVILAVILIGANLMMFAMARGMRGFKSDMFKNFGDSTRPWKKEDEGLRELNKLVHDLKPPRDDENKT